AVLAAPLVPVPGPGGDGPRAEPGAAARARMAAAGPAGGAPPAAGGGRRVARGAHNAGRVPAWGGLGAAPCRGGPGPVPGDPGREQVGKAVAPGPEEGRPR